jgi:hypothetical protein
MLDYNGVLIVDYDYYVRDDEMQGMGCLDCVAFAIDIIKFSQGCYLPHQVVPSGLIMDDGQVVISCKLNQLLSWSSSWIC